ncbi:fibronectin type III domain-containing protein [Cesiribacter sp. SM1]|uniref:fibronectin type III domain-containing protein n=1 Tax=Cesiribacter sp. SM1 TaxID=2861196 RepID=UPI001CD5420B|nr:fibronectin type III domain-containing protein [Cesiribacter sp. SM1]
MKKTLLLLAMLLCSSISVIAQDKCEPPKSPYGNDDKVHEWTYKDNLGAWTKEYKPFIINGMPFRLLYPKNWESDLINHPDKKYPLMIMLHGIGEDGYSSCFDNDEQLKDGGKIHLDARNSGEYDGFIMAPQAVGCKPTDTNCSSVFDSGERNAIRLFIDHAIKELRVNEYRVMLQGYSAGGGAGWKIAYDNYTKISGAILMSSAEPGVQPHHHNSSNFVERLKYTSLWHAQGGLDGRPRQSAAEQIETSYTAAGANYRLQLYPKVGHGTWKVMYHEDDFFSYMMRTHMLRPHALKFKSNFCPGEEVQGTMGIKQGFYQYEWQKDEVTIQKDNRNELVFNEEGSYRVRIQKTENSSWSEWGPPLEIKKVDFTPPVTIKASSSTAIPTLDEKYFVTLRAPKLDLNGQPYQDYVWYKDDRIIENETADSLVTSQAGNYTVVVTERLGCPSPVHSNAITVTGEINSNLQLPSNFTAAAVSETELILTWDDNNANETSYELYANRTNESPWELIATLPANTKSFAHKNLNFYTRYFYRLRAVNNNGSHAYLEKDYARTSGKTKKIDVSSSAPTGLKVSSSSRTHISLQWNPPAGLNNEEGVITYEIFDAVNQQVIATSTITEITLNDLAEKQWYTFAVRAVDLYKNKSPFSNQVTAGTFNQGLKYSYYEATLNWIDEIPPLTPVKTGTVATFNINANPNRPNDKFAYKFDGYIIIPESGEYTFYTRSDDGSRLYINDKVVVNHDGTHGSENDKSSEVQYLAAGAHKIQVLYFEKTGGGEMLRVSWEGPGIVKQEIPASALKDEYTQPNTPVAPSAFTATTKDHQSILLKWTDNSTNETGFEINRSTSNDGPFEFVATVEANKVEYLNSNLQPDTRYYYQLRALGNGGGSAFIGKGDDGTWVNTKTDIGSGSTEVNAPTELKAVRQNDTSVLLEWQDNSTNEDGFEVYRNGVLLATTTANKVSYLDQTAGGTTTYGYKVRAFKSSSFSDYSNTETILGTNHAPIMTKVGNLQVRYENITQIKLIASDKDKDALTYSATGLPGFATIIQNEDGTADLKIHPLRADAGTYENILLKVTDTKGGTCSELISLVVGENAAPGFFNPVTLTLYEKTSRTVDLSAWDANGELLDFTMEGAPSFIVLSNKGNNSASLTITPNYGHAGEYKFAVKATDPLGAVNFVNINVTVAEVVTNQKVLINFNDSFHEQAQAPWNNVARYPSLGTKLNNAYNTEGVSTSTDIRFIDGFGRAEGGTVTGSDANQDFPDAVLKTHYYGFTDQERQIKISGLNPDLSYSFTIIGSKAYAEDVQIITIYNINGIDKQLDVRNNTTNSVRFTNISTATGEIILSVRPEDPKQYSYINGLIIESEYIDNSQSLTPTQLSTVLTESGLVNVSWVDNAYNESGYELQKSIDGTNFSQLALLETNSMSFTDADVNSGATYHYRVRAVASNSNLSSAWSEVSIITIESDDAEDPGDGGDTDNPGDNPDENPGDDPGDDPNENPGDNPGTGNTGPALIADYTGVMHTVQGMEKTYTFTVTDPDVDDQLSLIIRYLPSFATLEEYDAVNKKAVITLKPELKDVGYYNGVQLTATDGELEADVTFSISITESDVISTYVNFMYDYPLRASRPWNNTNKWPSNANISSLRNESNEVQPYTISLRGTWNKFQAWGETSLDDSGVFPNATTKTAYVINKGSKGQVNVTGLKEGKIYNFIFFGSSVYKSNGGNTIYQIGSESVKLPVQSNIENTVQINGVKPVNGSVTINVSSEATDHGSFLNAMVIEEYTDENILYSPGKLLAHARIQQSGNNKWTHLIELKWIDRSKGESGFKIYRRTLPAGAFREIAQTEPNATTYTDMEGLVEDTGYEYYVSAVKGSVSAESNMAQTATLKSIVLLNFNYGGSYNAPSPPWNNTNLIPREYTKSNLKDYKNSGTPIDFRIDENFNGYNNKGPVANGTGVYPDPVSEQFYFVELGSTARLKFFELDPNLVYNFRFYAASVFGSDNGVTLYKIDNKQVSLDVQNNLTKTAIIRDIVAPNKQVTIELEGGEYARYGYINALEIEIRDGAKEKEGANLASKYNNEEATATAGITDEPNEVTTVYPNPTRDELFVNFLAEQEGRVTLQVMDLQGRTVYLQEVQAQEGDNVFRMNLGSENISKGMYILRIKSMDFTSKVVRFMKQ